MREKNTTSENNVREKNATSENNDNIPDSVEKMSQKTSYVNIVKQVENQNGINDSH